MEMMKILLHREGLSDDENRIYRYFNIFLIFGLVDVIVIAAALKGIEPVWPFYLLTIEFVLFLIMLMLHVNGYLTLSRYLTFVLAIVLQTVACITHGSSAGFDYIFFITSVLPMMCFDNGKHYISLFIMSTLAHAFVIYNYGQAEPIIVIASQFPLYWNILFTSLMIFGIMYSFKRSFLVAQQSLIKKNELITEQKTEIESMNDNLEQLVVDRTKKIKEHEKRFIEFANINAHKVRSPLSRILGLLNIIKLEQDKQKVVTEFLPILQSNADELNTILNEVGDTLNRTALSEDDPEKTS